MLIKYIGRYGNVDDAIRQNHTGLYLRQDNWDDFTYKTYFQTTFIVDGEEVEIGSVRILIEGQKTSYSFLNQLIETDVWDGVFPIPGILQSWSSIK